MRTCLRASALLTAAALCGLALAEFTGPAPLAWRWAQPTRVASGGVPQIQGDRVYVAVGGRIYAVDRTTGNTIWRFPRGEAAEANFRNGCILADGKVFAAADDGSVYAVDAATGNLAWQHLHPVAVTTNLVSAGANVFFGDTRNQIHGLNRDSGQPVSQAGVAVSEGLQTRLGSVEGAVLYSTGRGSLVRLNPVTLRPDWTQRFQRLSNNGSFTVFGERIYVNSGSFVAAARASNGAIIWQRNVGRDLDLAPAAGPDGVAVVSRDGNLFTYNLQGNAVFPRGVKLDSAPIVPPVFVGRFVAVAGTNGALNLVNPTTGDLVWNYVLPPIVTRVSTPATGGAAGGGNAGEMGGAAGGLGVGSGAAGGGQAAGTPTVATFTQAGGSPVLAGDSLMLVTRDGSLLLFDKNLGVDLTAPTTRMVWPTPGQEVAGKAPMEIVFRLEDVGIGVNPESIKIDINGQNYIGELSRDGFLSIRITSASTVNRPLQNGRAVITVTASDWLGNTSVTKVNLSIDNTLNALGSPRRPDAAGAAGGGVLGGGGGRG